MSHIGWLAPDATSDERQAFGSLDQIVAATGQVIDDSGLSRLVRCDVAGKSYYVKVYRHAGRYLRRFAGRSRVRAEWENQRLFERWGVPTARAVAFGERRRELAGYCGAVVSEELAGTLDLWSLIKKHPERLSDRDWIDNVIDRLARHVRTLHGYRFVHNDLKWRNILVDFSKRPEVYIIDCPLGRVSRGPLLDRGIVKDLACLDRVAKLHLSRSQRLRFFLRYHEVGRLAAKERGQAKKVLSFFEGRE